MTETAPCNFLIIRALVIGTCLGFGIWCLGFRRGACTRNATDQ